jgi:hypothetical protein
LELETKDKVSATAVKTELKPVEDRTVYFRDLADMHMQEQFQCGNYDVIRTDKARLKRFYKFAKDGKVTFPDKIAIQPLSERTITNHLFILSAIYNRAISAKLASKEDYHLGRMARLPSGSLNLLK